MKPTPLKTLGDAAKEFGCTHHTIRFLINQLGIVPKKVPHSPNGKGLDPSDLRAIRRALRPIVKSGARASAR